MTTRYVAGAMTGTSLDGLDAALVRIDGHGLDTHADYTAHISVPLGELTAPLRALAQGSPMPAGDIAQLSLSFGELHLLAIQQLARDHRVDLVAVHGQTVFHQPPLSWQLINPWPIVRGLNLPVVLDLRGADLAAAGQGAPITPLADYILFRSDTETRVVVNLGGFINFTRIPASTDPSRIEAGDVCVCNQLLDAVARLGWSAPYDDGGCHAQGGRVIGPLFNDIIDKLSIQVNCRRSLGTGDENIELIHSYLNRYPAGDVARTACAAIAQAIVGVVGPCDRLILAGGGILNGCLVNQVRQSIGGAVGISDDLGVPAQAREAVEIAVLGALCQDRVPITLPQVTGCRTPAPISGCWVYP